MDEHNRNFIMAIVLSMAVLFAWQFFFLPEPEAARSRRNNSSRRARTAATRLRRREPRHDRAAVPFDRRCRADPRSRHLPLPRALPIDTPSLKGSIALKGARIDDLTLKDYRVTVEPNSPNVVLLSPAGGPQAYYAEHGFVGRRR